MDQITPLTDAEARQPRVLTGDRIMRVTQRGLNVPARPYADGIIYLVEGNARQFENQAANLIELTTEAALRLQDAVEDADDEGKDAEDFVFAVTLADLTIRKRAFVHAPFAEQRDSLFVDEAQFAQPIVGLDVDEDGNAIDVQTLRKAIRLAQRAPVPAGFTAATGGAFEDVPVPASAPAESEDEADSEE